MTEPDQPLALPLASHAAQQAPGPLRQQQNSGKRRAPPRQSQKKRSRHSTGRQQPRRASVNYPPPPDFGFYPGWAVAAGEQWQQQQPALDQPFPWHASPVNQGAGFDTSGAAFGRFAKPKRRRLVKRRASTPRYPPPAPFNNNEYILRVHHRSAGTFAPISPARSPARPPRSPSAHSTGTRNRPALLNGIPIHAYAHAVSDNETDNDSSDDAHSVGSCNATHEASATVGAQSPDRLAALEAENADLREELETLRAQLATHNQRQHVESLNDLEASSALMRLA